MSGSGADGRALLAWFRRVERPLPWRATRDPYPILVSEIMLQQTQVARVVDYYELFLEAFPTVEALAAASEEEVLARWSGLGYYRRAGFLQQAARAVVERGGFPATAAELETLPGVGPYTAAAVASIAFGEVVPVLDGNVVRVVARRLGVTDSPTRAAVRRRLLAAAAELLDPADPGGSNQALMELGSEVCRPRRPACGVCPLGPACVARMEGLVDEIPVRAKARRERRRWTVAVVRERGRWLAVRRGRGEALLASLWELPWVEGSHGELEEAFEHRYGGSWRIGEELGRVRHAITWRDLEVRAVVASWAPPVTGSDAWSWLEAGELLGRPHSSLVEKVVALVPTGTG